MRTKTGCIMTSRHTVRTLIVVVFLCTAARVHGAAESFNPAPPQFETPNDDLAAVTARLSTGSEGKTPTEKQFDPAWIKALATPGQPVVRTAADSSHLDYIGMPIGGIGAGELYLGGDGRLWMWDIFNTRVQPKFPVEGGLAYIHPHVINDATDAGQTVIDQGFVLRTTSDGKTTTHTLDRDGFPDVKFTGQYPIGYVDYAAADCPVRVRLQAFSPFVPGDVKDSSLPATIMNFTLTNPTKSPVTCELGGWLENGAAIESRSLFDVDLQNKVTGGANATTISETAAEPQPAVEHQKPIVFDDFESGTFANWTADGDAFKAPMSPGKIPIPIAKDNPDFRPPTAFGGKFLVNSFGDDPQNERRGTLKSKQFTIERSFITFLLGGENYPDKVCVNLLVDGKVVDSATGHNNGDLRPVYWKVEQYRGKTAQLQIVDQHQNKAKWAHILVDDFVFRDTLDDLGSLADRPDIGTMALTIVDQSPATTAFARLPAGASAAGVLASSTDSVTADLLPKAPADRLVGGIKHQLTLAPDSQQTVTFLVTWHFPNPLNLSLKTPMQRQYTTRFKSADDVAQFVAGDLDRLTKLTRLWHDTWCDSTLPQWLLNRTFLNVSTLATGTSYLLSDGRFYGYEGCYSCPGTCTHVWGYQQALGYLFPELEKSVLEKVEFTDLGMNPAGGVAMRAEFDKNPPVDGQAGIIMRAYLADRMSANDDFLKTNYASIKKATDYLVNTYDADKNGIMDGDQRNTMDAGWWGEVAWLSLYYQSALLATAQMADRMNDADYAASLRAIESKGRDYIEQKLFNGEYFFHQADPAHDKSPGTYIGCHIDQLMGQNWAYQVGLGTIVDPQRATTALNSIWKYSYTTDIAPYRKPIDFSRGRTYVKPGEGGVIMCTFPLGGADALHKGLGQFAAYMNEIWGGCEHELAATMMWQGLVDKALAVERTLDDRYAAAKSVIRGTNANAAATTADRCRAMACSQRHAVMNTMDRMATWLSLRGSGRRILRRRSRARMGGAASGRSTAVTDWMHRSRWRTASLVWPVSPYSCQKKTSRRMSS